ncbi:hypothetical protein YC2023_024893 [Brassica napus]
MGESLAILEVLLHTAPVNLLHICTQTDFQVLVIAISSRRRLTELYGILTNIDDLSLSSISACLSCYFGFTLGSCNDLADGLEKIEISIIEEEIEVGWSNFTSKCYYKDEKSNGLEML